MCTGTKSWRPKCVARGAMRVARSEGHFQAEISRRENDISKEVYYRRHITHAFYRHRHFKSRNVAVGGGVKCCTKEMYRSSNTIQYCSTSQSEPSCISSQRTPIYMVKVRHFRPIAPRQHALTRTVLVFDSNTLLFSR